MKNQKGITLVALIITIIVMLILAGVSISLVVGEDGVLTQAQNAGDKSKQGEIRQAMELAFSDLTMQYYQKTDDTATKDYNEAQVVFEIPNVVATMAANSNGAFTADNISLAGALDFKYLDDQDEDKVKVFEYDANTSNNYAKEADAEADAMGTTVLELANGKFLGVYAQDKVNPDDLSVETVSKGSDSINSAKVTVSDGAAYMLGDGDLYVNVNISGVDYLYKLTVNKGRNTYTLGSITEVEVAE